VRSWVAVYRPAVCNRALRLSPACSHPSNNSPPLQETGGIPSSAPRKTPHHTPADSRPGAVAGGRGGRGPRWTLARAPPGPPCRCSTGPSPPSPGRPADLKSSAAQSGPGRTRPACPVACWRVAAGPSGSDRGHGGSSGSPGEEQAPLPRAPNSLPYDLSHPVLRGFGIFRVTPLGWLGAKALQGCI
jgi:hypothetical protein